VEFDAGLLKSSKKLPDVNVVNDIALNGAKGSSVTSNDPTLLTVSYVIVANNMVPDVLWGPIALLEDAFNGLMVSIEAVLNTAIATVKKLAEGDASAPRVCYGVVLDQPPLGPVDANETNLFGGGGRPGRCRLTQGEPFHRNIVHPSFGRVEHRLSDIHFYQILVGIQIAKIGEQRGFHLIVVGVPAHAGI
jgi:hypothetical protein